MPDEPIKTSVDDLVNYVYEHGETNSYALSAMLNVNEKTIEAWIDALEEAQIVRVIYKFDKMFVSPMTVMKESMEMKGGYALSGSTVQISVTNQLKMRLEEFWSYVASLEGDLVDKEEKLLDKLRDMAGAGKEKERTDPQK